MEKELATPAAKEGEGNTETPKEPLETLDTLVPEEPKDIEKAEQIAKDQRKRAEKAEERAAELQQEIAKLQNSALSGSKKIGEINSELKALANEYNVDEEFVARLVSTVQSATKNEIKEELEKDYSPKFIKLEQQRQLEQSEKKFEELYSKTLKQMPEYAGLINKDVIKTLAFNAGNAKKTLPEIIEDTYSGALQGKKSIETAHASRDPETPNVVNPTKEDWDKIESDPKAKEAWGKQVEQDIKKFL